MNRLSTSLILAFLLGLFASTAGAAGQTGAATGAVVGTVDLAALLVFHPAMAAYDPFNRAFLKGQAVTQPKELNRRNKESNERIQGYQDKIKALETRMNELRARFDEDQRREQGEHDKRLPGLAEGRATHENYKFAVKMNALSLKFNSQMRALQVQIDQLQEAISNDLSGGPGARYTSPAETQQRFAGLFAEIQRLTQQVAATRGVSVVFDSSFSRPGRLSPDNREPDLPSNLEYGEMLGQTMPQGLDKDSGAVQGFYDLQRSRAENWYRNRDPILTPFAGQLGTSFVVTGGLDLTSEVMTAILTQYRIDKRMQDVVLQAIRSGK